MKRIIRYVTKRLEAETPSEIARKSGIDKTRVWRIMRAGSDMTVTELEIICEAYGITFERIMWDLTNPSGANV